MAGVRNNTVSNVVSGSIASFKSVGQVSLKSLKVNFNPIQEGDGDPSPSNIRPISGWTGLNVYKGSKNFLTDTVVYVSTVRKTEMEYTVQNNSATIDRKANVSAFILIKALDNITSDMVGMQFVYTASNYNTNDAIVSCNSTGNNRRTVTNGIITSEDVGKILTVRFYAGGEIKTYTATNMQLSLNSTSTTYEPYNGTTIPVSWSDLGTVYGGYIDLIKGKLVEKYGVADIDSFDYSLNTVLVGVDRYVAQKPSNCKNIGNSQSCPNQVSDIYGVEAIYEANYNYSTWITTILNGQILFYVPANTYSSIEDFKTAMSGHKIYYELTTPIEYDINPITIKSLIGTNNIWSNADTVEVQYCALESLDIYKQRFKTNEPHLQTSSGNLVSFNTDMVAPLKECKINFLPIQAAGTPSPDNVLPITGWTDLDIYHHGETLPITYSVNTTTSYGVTWTVSSDGTVHAEGTPTSYVGCVYGEINVNGDEVLYGVIKGSLNNVAFNKPGLFDANGNTITTNLPDNALVNGLDLSQFTGVKKVRVTIKRSRNSVYMQGDARVIVQKNTPPSIDTTSITLPSTYYGGWVDLTSGEIWATYEYTNLGEKNWTADDQTTQPGCFRAGNGYFGNENGIKYMGANYCSQFTAVQKSSWTQVGYGEISVTNSTFNPIVRIRDERFIDKTGDEVKTLLSGVYYAYERAVPQLVGTLTSTQLKTLKNQNNVWSNTNGITQVKYWTHGSIADKRKVVWNQWAPPLISDYWNDRNSTETITTFENGIATTQFILLSGAYHTMCTKNSSRTYQNHKYYSRLDCMLNKSVDYMGGDVANIAWSKPFIGNLNEWGTYSTIVTGEKDRNSTIYYPRMTRSGGLQQGTIAKTKNPFVIDLTQMFGEGNEPSTAAEFEALCVKNNIDLTQYHPYDEGTQMYWYF